MRSTEYGFADLLPSLLSLQAEALLGLERTQEALERIDAATERLNNSPYQAYLVYYRRYRVLHAAGQFDEADEALAEAHADLTSMIDTLDPQDVDHSRTGIPEHRLILDTWQERRPLMRTVHLPCVDTPHGYAPTEDKQVAVDWTIETAADRRVSNRSQRRRQQLMRLLHEAQAKGAIPAYHHLADALEVSERTIQRDMAHLRQRYPDLPPTRGDLSPS